MKPFLPPIVAALVVAAAAYAGYRNASAEARRGWELAPVLVAGHDLAAGAALTADEFAQRLMPTQFITSSAIKPESYSSVLGQKPRIDLKKGDPLLWSQFAK